MTKRKIVGLSLHDDDIEILNQVAAEVGLTKSELIRRMLKKISFDDKMKAIIKSGKVITSNNVHSVNDKNSADKTEGKKDPGDQSGEDSSSLDPTNNILENYSEEQLKILCTNWPKLAGVEL